MTAGKSPKYWRRLLWIGAAVVAAAVVGGVGWYAWLHYTAPLLPDVALDGLDPAVAEAIGKARRGVLADSRSAAAWGQLGKVLLANGFERPADACFAKAERLDPDEPRWPYYQGLRLAQPNPDAAIPFLRRAVELADKYDRRNDAPRLLLAETLLQTESYGEAGCQLNLLTRNSDDPRVHYDRGVLAVARRDDETAGQEFAAIIASPSARQKACAALAAIRQRQGDAAGAADYGKRAAAPPEDAAWDDPYVTEYLKLAVGRRCRLAEAQSLEKAGRLEEAMPILRGLAQDASDGHAQLMTGMALFDLGRAEEAEHYFRAAVRLSTEEAQANYSLAVVLCAEAARLERQRPSEMRAARAKYSEAADCADRALELKPDHAMAHLYRGFALAGLGRKKEAIESFRHAALLSPEVVEPHMALGEALAEDGRDTEAVVQFQQACDLAPPADPQPRQALERVKARLHKPE